MAELRRHLIAVIAGVLGLLPLGVAASTGDKPIVEWVAMSDFVGRDQLYYLRSPSDAELLAVPVLRRSLPVEARSKTTPIVVGTKQVDAKTGATTYKAVAQMNWPDGSPDRVLVFIAPGSGGGIQAVCVDDSLETFPARTLRILNFTGETLLGKFGSFEGAIAPGVQPAVAYPRTDAPVGTTGRFRVGIAKRDQAGAAKLLFNGWTEAWPQARTLLLIRREGSRVLVRSLVETLPATKE